MTLMKKAPKLVRLDEARAKATRKRIEQRIKKVLDAQFNDSGGLAGFALVVWGYEGSSTADLATDGGISPTILIPDFVRARLLAEKIEGWTIDSINASGGVQ